MSTSAESGPTGVVPVAGDVVADEAGAGCAVVDVVAAVSASTVTGANVGGGSVIGANEGPVSGADDAVSPTRPSSLHAAPVSTIPRARPTAATLTRRRPHRCLGPAPTGSRGHPDAVAPRPLPVPRCSWRSRARPAPVPPSEEEEAAEAAEEVERWSARRS